MVGVFADEVSDVGGWGKFSGGGVPSEDIEEDPEGEDGEEVEGGDVADDELEEVGDPEGGAFMGFGEAFFYADDPAESDDDDCGHDEDEEGADPEVDGIEGFEVFTEVDDEEAPDGGEEAEEGDGLFPVEAEGFFEEGDTGLEHGEGAGDCGEEEEGKEDGAEEVREGHGGEDEGEDFEAEGEGALADDAGATEEDEGGGDGDHAAEGDFAAFIGAGGGEAAEDDIIGFAEVAGVGDDDAEADGEGEEDLAGCGEPELGVFELGTDVTWVPHEAEAIDEVLVGEVGVRGSEGEDADEDDDGEDDEGGHGPEAEFLDTFGEAAVDDDVIEDIDDEEEEDDLVMVFAECEAIGGSADEVGPIILVGLDIGAEVHMAGDVAVGVAEAPGFDVDIVHVDYHGDDDAEDADVFAPWVADDGVEDTWAGVEALLAGVAAEGPFCPADGDTEDEEGEEVSDHEGAAAVLGGEAWEAEEVAEAHGAAGDCEDDTHAGGPAFWGLGRWHAGF